MTSMQFSHLPLPGKVPDIVSNDPQLLTAWNSIKAWYQRVLESNEDKSILVYHACFIMMTGRFINLRASQLVREGTAVKLEGGLLIRKMQAVSGELQKVQAVTDFVGQRGSLQASVDVGTTLYIALYDQRNQFRPNQPLPKGELAPILRIWTMISFAIKLDPQAKNVKSSEVKAKLSWLQKQSDESLKRPHGQEEVGDERSKKAKIAASETIWRIEVSDPRDLEVIRRYDNAIGIVPTEGPVKNRSVVTVYDVSTLAQGEWVNDVAIDAYLTLVCHTFNGLFHEGVELPRSPRCHAWSVQMSNYLSGRSPSFEERHLREEWPPARFPHAALEDVSCHIFPLHVRGHHWILMMLRKADDGQWTLFCFSSLAGYGEDFGKPWPVISSWLLFKSKGALDVRQPRAIIPSPQPTQENDRDCGVFVCGIVRWSLEAWDLSTLTPSIIPEYRRRMILEIERWGLSTNRV